MKQTHTKTQKNKNKEINKNLEKSIESNTSLILSFYNLITNHSDIPNNVYTYLCQDISKDRHIEFSNYISSLVSLGLLEPMVGAFSSDIDQELSTSSHNQSFSFYKYIPIDKPKKVNISAYRKIIEKLFKKYKDQKDFRDTLLDLSRMTDQDIDFLINSDVYICIREVELLKCTSTKQQDLPEATDVDGAIKGALKEKERKDKKVEFFIIYKGLGQKLKLGFDANDNFCSFFDANLCPLIFDSSLAPWDSLNVERSRFLFFLFPCALDSFLYLLGETTRGGGQQEFFGFLNIVDCSLTAYKKRCYFTWGEEKIIMHTDKEKIGELVDSKIRNFAYVPEGGKYIYG